MSEYAGIRSVQREIIAEEWNNAGKERSVFTRSHKDGSTLHGLIFTTRKDGLIRLRGRLKNPEELEGTKHSVVIPARHRLTQMIIKHYHEKLLHTGPQLLLIRQQYTKAET